MSVAAHSQASAGREVATISAVGAAHFASHLQQLALAPLFIAMRADLGVSFTDLGLLLSVFYLFSGTGQVLAGVLVDRFGADRLLVCGILLQSAATAMLGLAPTYAAMLPLAALGGLGNSVYHPADLSILSHRVRSERLGRAFAAHVIAGNAGFAVSPLAVGALAVMFGWRGALIGLGGACFALGIALFAARPLLRTEPHARTARTVDGAVLAPLKFVHVLAMPVVLLAFLYFVLSSLALGGVQNFSITALQEGFCLSAATAAFTLTLYQVATIGGVMVGGILADRTTSHHRIAMAGLAGASVACASVGLVPGVPPALLLPLVGLLVGVTMPARDVLVRRATPKGATGKVFGVVYSGFDIGFLIGPVLYGAMLDHHLNRALFVVAAVPLALAVVTVMGVRPGGRSTAA